MSILEQNFIILVNELTAFQVLLLHHGLGNFRLILVERVRVNPF